MHAFIRGGARGAGRVARRVDFTSRDSIKGGGAGPNPYPLFLNPTLPRVGLRAAGVVSLD